MWDEYLHLTASTITNTCSSHSPGAISRCVRYFSVAWNVRARPIPAILSFWTWMSSHNCIARSWLKVGSTTTHWNARSLIRSQNALKYDKNVTWILWKKAAKYAACNKYETVHRSSTRHESENVPRDKIESEVTLAHKRNWASCWLITTVCTNTWRWRCSRFPLSCFWLCPNAIWISNFHWNLNRWFETPNRSVFYRSTFTRADTNWRGQWIVFVSTQSICFLRSLINPENPLAAGYRPSEITKQISSSHTLLCINRFIFLKCSINF